MLSVLPPAQRPKNAPATDNGKMVSTVIGCMNELNCAAKIMYATAMPNIKAKPRLCIES